MAHRAALAKRAPLVLWAAVLLVVPGVFLSVALGAIGAVILASLLLDFAVFARDDVAPARIPLALQALLAVGASSAIGVAIAFGAWLDH